MPYPHIDPSQSVFAKDLFSVKNHVVVITGGGTGLGKYMASGLFKNGARVYIVGRRGEVLDEAVRDIQSKMKPEESEGTIVAVQGDVSTKAGALEIATKLKGLVDHVDVLVNNAAVQKSWRNPMKDPAGHDDPDQVERLLWDGVEDEDFNSTNSININGTYWMTAALVPLLRESEIKSVIVISSIAATANQRATSSLTYGVSKVSPTIPNKADIRLVVHPQTLAITELIAVSHLATMLAGRLSPLKIRVNTICPGTFASELTSTISSDGSVNMLEGAGKACMRTPLRRAGYKHEILGPVMLLVSKAGGYMDNAVLAVDGGRNMVAGINDGVPLPDEAY